jgi:hypothetical protein
MEKEELDTLLKDLFSKSDDEAEHLTTGIHP